MVSVGDSVDNRRESVSHQIDLGMSLPFARLLMLLQWRAGLRISEALALEVRDVMFDPDHQVLRVRRGKGHKPRVVPLHPELEAALRLTIEYRPTRQDERLIGASRPAASRWIDKTRERGIANGVLHGSRHWSSHTLRHSFARHMLAHGVPINVLSRWLGHASIQQTFVYLALVPDPERAMRGGYREPGGQRSPECNPKERRSSTHVAELKTERVECHCADCSFDAVDAIDYDELVEHINQHVAETAHEVVVSVGYRVQPMAVKRGELAV